MSQLVMTSQARHNTRPTHTHAHTHLAQALHAVQLLLIKVQQLVGGQPPVAIQVAAPVRTHRAGSGGARGAGRRGFGCGRGRHLEPQVVSIVKKTQQHSGLPDSRT